MKTVKNALIAVAGVITIMAPLSLGAIAHAQSGPSVLPCSNGDQVQAFDESATCDLQIDKQVSVNGGTFVDADTAPDAAQAHVGDTIVWKITVSKSALSINPTASYVYVKDDMPSGFNVTNVMPSAGTWGVFASDIWALPLFGDESSNLPATLTFTSTSTATGLFQNTASFYRFEAFGCPDGGCVYVDGNTPNNSNDAWVDPSAKPQVLADTTTASSGQVLADTGSTSSTIVSMIAATIIVSTIAVSFIGRTKRI